MKNVSILKSLITSVTLAGFFLLSTGSYCQQKAPDKEKGKKTITIHVTTETDGKVVKTDTTIVTEGDFDADAFLKEKGLEMKDQDMKMKKQEKEMEEQVIMTHPGTKTITMTESDGDGPDTIIIKEGHAIMSDESFDMPVPPPPPGAYYYNYNYKMPQHQFMNQQHMMEGMIRSMGLEDMMPLGRLDNIVVKKKHNGKKVIISFKDNGKSCCEGKGGDAKQEKVIIYKNGDQGMAPQNEEHYVIQGENGEKIIVNKNVETNGNEKKVTIKADVDKSAPVKQEKKVIIIKEQEPEQK